MTKTIIIFPYSISGIIKERSWCLIVNWFCSQIPLHLGKIPTKQTTKLIQNSFCISENMYYCLKSLWEDKYEVVLQKNIKKKKAKPDVNCLVEEHQPIIECFKHYIKQQNIIWGMCPAEYFWTSGFFPLFSWSSEVGLVKICFSHIIYVIVSFCVSCSFRLCHVNTVGQRWLFPQIQLYLMWIVFLSWSWLKELVLLSSVTLQASVPKPCCFRPEIFPPLLLFRGDRKSTLLFIWIFGQQTDFQSSWATSASEGRTSLWRLRAHLCRLSGPWSSSHSMAGAFGPDYRACRTH